MRSHVVVWVLGASMVASMMAGASHFQTYRTHPVTHDLLGAVPEPDFATTSVLGPTVTNCVVDAPPFAVCGDDASPSGAYAFGEIAPGCMGNGPARVQSGQCGLWTVGHNNAPPPGLAGNPGMGGPTAPGAFSPLKSSAVRFLDGRVSEVVGQNPSNPGGLYLPVHDFFRLETNNAALASTYGLTFAYSPWAWFGTWRDLNGNGVIDHVTPGTAGPTVNEFTWLGACTDVAGAFQASSVSSGLCSEFVNPHVPGAKPCSGNAPPCGAATSMHLYMYPGNHHGGHVFAASGHGPAHAGFWGDMPMNQYWNWLHHGNCNVPPTCEEEAAMTTANGGFGDPILDMQHAVTFDDVLLDRTGDPGDTTRMWLGFEGLAGQNWDDGIVTSMVHVFAVNCAPTSTSPAGVDLATCAFTDVDKFQSLHPALEAALGGMKATARSAFQLISCGAPPC